MKFLKPLLTCILFILAGCSAVRRTSQNTETSVVAKVILDKGAYKKGDSVNLSLVFKNTGTKEATVSNLVLTVKNISRPSNGYSSTMPLKKVWKLKKGTEQSFKTRFFKQIPKNYTDDAYGIYISYELNGKQISAGYRTFFRIIKDDEITVFNIDTENVDGVPVFKLDGGMSAEYIVEKSAENLTFGISHSWEVNAPGSGPNHVLGTPDFLERSVEQTVSFYDGILGDARPIETVLVTPGFTSIPYISKSLNAVVLPLHFLVSVNTVKEIETILKTANDKDIPSYATLSHDPSVPYAVAWVKLLSLPGAYTDFLKRHRVKHLVIMGATGTSEGETKAKKIVYQNEASREYAPKSIYIMYPGTSPDDVETLNTKIVDLNEYNQQDDYIQIADWESGINPVQIQNFVSDGKSIPNINVSTILAEDLGHLYNLGTYTTIALMAKNKERLGIPKGIIFNPYLIAHPSYELKMGYVPLLYWQLVGANYTVDRMEHCAIKGINHYFPGASTKNLEFWLNSTRNFGASWSADNLRKELRKRGFSNIREGDYTVDEVWKPADGINAPCELIFNDLQKIGYENFKNWSGSLIPLNLSDIKSISEEFGGFEIRAY